MYDFENRKKIAIDAMLETESLQQSGQIEKDWYRTHQIFKFISDENSREYLMQDIIYAAEWFEHPNVRGRCPRGEADFQAIRLIPLFYECYDALSDEAKCAMDRFFLKRMFFSFYESENHALMNRVSRYLAAQFYMDKGVFFEQFNPWEPEGLYKKDSDFINDFLDFRAKCGWGEFDSYGYTAEILYILNVLYSYTRDSKLKRKTAMMMDIILMDMICDSKNGLYGGAHGRIYPAATLDTENSGMFGIYCFYFGKRFDFDFVKHPVPSSLLLSDYVPSPIVYKIEAEREYPYINRERKHLHSPHAWLSEHGYCRLTIKLLAPYSINKQTYVDDRYLLGGINRQDPYPEDSDDRGYAHHQQHEWELTLPGGTNHKIFSHHPGNPGYHNQHNRWTGDIGCCCSTHYTNKNVAISLYNITKPDEMDMINAYVPLDIFDDILTDGNYLFLKYPGLYISMYFSSGYKINKEDEFANKELTSQGRKHAVILHVEKEEKFASMADFKEYIHSKKIDFDTENMTVRYDDIYVSYDKNGEDGKDNIYPYKYLYDCPYMKSVWDSGVIELIHNDDVYEYDFGAVTITKR